MGKKTEESDCQKQFEAAVSVIQGLPKNGSYSPSYEEKLRFYSYYKQATVGQCQIPRPGFWDPIGRYKWDAWNRLGKMTKEEAMAAYVGEMKKAAQKVINTVPLDESSENMFVYFEHLYEVIHDMPRPPDSFFQKKAGPGHMDKAIKSNQVTSDSESEVFCDSLEQVEPEQPRRLSVKQSLPLNSPQRVAEEKSHHMPSEHAPLSAREGKLYQGATTDLQSDPIEKGLNSNPEVFGGSPAGTLGQREVDLQVTNTIHALQQDMKNVKERLSYLESWAALQGHTSTLNPCLPTIPHDEKEPPRWPIHLSPPSWIFLLAWPFVVQWLLWCFQRQKRIAELEETARAIQSNTLPCYFSYFN
ncbi:acyl-CoA-binding domain-containing protein 4 isoform X2 [Sceloporus undulatus]|uniref:acyl-CoA-binding domain-containing protein 4 isoform X2 n=2 Tax=Sceloporus undulatus TaxID=8520 RepID=UPI001C4C453C|nr:acyl-CoA-binding domain-containing protein 4 isoform X2 [Sceloporus undulatus]